MSRRITTSRLRPAVKASFVAAASALIGVAAASAQTLAQPAQTALEQSAASYIQYRADVDFVRKNGLNSPADVRRAHNRLAGHDAAAFANGWIAYAALVAADTPAFADGLRKVAGKKKARAEFIARLNADPRAPASVPGAREAIGEVLLVAVKDARAFDALGADLQQQAYAMQSTNWGEKKLAASGAQRIAESKSFRATRQRASAKIARGDNRGVTTPALAKADAVWTPGWSAIASGTPSLDDKAGSTLDRVMYLATRYALGDLTPELLAAFGANKRGSRCISLAQSSLDACMSATNYPYEEAFCLGRHALQDVAGCVGAVAQ